MTRDERRAQAGTKAAAQAEEWRRARVAVEELGEATGQALRLDATPSMGGYRVYEVVFAGVMRPIPMGRRLPFGPKRYPTVAGLLASLRRG